MNDFQHVIIILVALIGFFISIQGYRETKTEKNAFSPTPLLSVFGIFVWGDAVIFGPFWIISSFCALIFRDWNLFLLIVSVFWLIRSAGETMYWIHQQFSTIRRNPPEKLIGYRIFRNDSIWFAYQIFWQCITVVSIITTIYFASLWLK